MHHIPRKPVARYSSVPYDAGSRSVNEDDNNNPKQQDVVMQEWVPTSESGGGPRYGQEDGGLLDKPPTYGRFSRRKSNDTHAQINSRRILQNWWVEVLACFLALAALMAIVGILYPHRDLPLPRLPYKLTINSLVSICIVVIKTALLLVVAQGLSQLKWTWFKDNRPLKDFETYDQASRGSPVGAFHLIWTLRHRHLVSSIGAIIVILALVIDPFAQQVVGFIPCSTNSTTERASLPRANYYFGEEGTPGGPHHLDAGYSTVVSGMQAAINNGIFDPQKQQVTFSCSTGNCTFPEPYSSIGFCSSCEDVSSQLQIILGKGDGSTNYTLPSSNLTAQKGIESLVLGISPNQDPMHTFGTIIQIIMAYQTKVYNATGGHPACFADDEWGCRGYGAAECSIWPCTRSFNASVAAGNLAENNVPNSFVSEFGVNTTSGSQPLFFFTTADLQCLSEPQKTLLRDDGYSWDDRSRWLAYNISIPESYDETSTTFLSVDAVNEYFRNKTLDASCFYVINDLTLMSLFAFIETVFTAQLPYGSYGYGTDYGNNIYIPQAMFNLGNITFASVESNFQNMTSSMTNFMRESGASLYNTSVTGIVVNEVTCVKVRWGWLVFPAVLIGLTLIFFVLLIIQTRYDSEQQNGGDHVYKSSALALLVHGLDTKTYDELDDGSKGNIEKIRRKAREIYVKWTPTENGYKLAQVVPNGSQ